MYLHVQKLGGQRGEGCLFMGTMCIFVWDSYCAVFVRIMIHKATVSTVLSTILFE